jgi:protein phosphatase 1 regulatory subunit 12A
MDSELHIVCARRDTSKARALIEDGADVNCGNGDGLTALHIACTYDAITLSDLLIEKRAN